MVNNKSLVILAALIASAAAHFRDTLNADGSVAVPGTAGPGPAAGAGGSEGDAPTPDGESPKDPAPVDAVAGEDAAEDTTATEEIVMSDMEVGDADSPAEGGGEEDGGSSLAPVVVGAGAGGAASAAVAGAAAGVGGDAAEAADAAEGGVNTAADADAPAPAAATTVSAADTDASSTDEDVDAASPVEAKSDASVDPDVSPNPLATEEEDLGASPSNEDEDSVCFPGSATVELESGAVVRMDDLSVGDMVKVGVNEFSRVFMFTHKMAEARNAFVSIKTASGAEIALTSGHYLYVNGALAAAKTVDTGDVLTLGNGDATSVTSVGSIEGTGLFNPQTVSGNVVVSGVLSSTYTTAVEPSFAHVILAPFRALQNLVTLTGLESGGGALADVAPRGQTVF